MESKKIIKSEKIALPSLVDCEYFLTDSKGIPKQSSLLLKVEEFKTDADLSQFQIDYRIQSALSEDQVDLRHVYQLQGSRLQTRNHYLVLKRVGDEAYLFPVSGLIRFNKKFRNVNKVQFLDETGQKFIVLKEKIDG